MKPLYIDRSRRFSFRGKFWITFCILEALVIYLILK